MKTEKTNCQKTITTQTFYSTLVHLSPLSVRASFFTFSRWVRFEAFVSSRKTAKKGAGGRAPLSCRRSFVGEASSIAAAAPAVVRRAPRSLVAQPEKRSAPTLGTRRSFIALAFQGTAARRVGSKSWLVARRARFPQAEKKRCSSIERRRHRRRGRSEALLFQLTTLLFSLFISLPVRSIKHSRQPSSRRASCAPRARRSWRDR